MKHYRKSIGSLRPNTPRTIINMIKLIDKTINIHAYKNSSTNQQFPKKP